jgi:hypothetical protein
MQAIGSLAVPVLRYSFGIIKRKYKSWIEKQEKCLPSMDSIIQVQTLIVYVFPEKTEEED